MTEVLVVLAAVAAFGVCGLMTAVGLARWRLGRRNRVDPKVASPAPLRWLASPSEPARLHRRLRAISRVGIADPEIDDAATVEIVTVAARLDRRAVIVASCPAADRRHHLRTLRAEVAELDELTRRLARPLSGPVGHRAEIDTLRLLADARDEIEAIDRG